jgi:tyrosyl-tRNA synthetase
VLLGGATGAIGDPSGRNAERTLLDRAVVDQNVATQKEQFKALFGRFNITPTFVNNLDWFGGIKFLDFLRDIGKHFTLGYMLQKDSVKNRLEGDGMSYTEFSYMLLQAYDFLHLFEKHDCKLHVGGSDQWGNITAGLELIRRKGLHGAQAITFPLITDSQGKKLGKSEGGAIWLDSKMTSPFKLHQYFLNVADSDAVKFLKILTFLPQEKIQEIENNSKEQPEKRLAQNTLADEVCSFVHGADATAGARKSASVLFGGDIKGISAAQLNDIFAEVPSTALSKDQINGHAAIDLLVTTKLSKSKGEAKRLIESGGAYINNERIGDIGMKIGPEHLIDGELLVLRAGKKSYHLVRQSA